MNKWVLVVAASALALTVAGCTGSSAPAKAVDVAISAKDMHFEPKEITLKKGEAVKLSFTNSDSQLHDFSVDKISVKMNASHSDGHNMGGKTPDLHVSADAGKTGTIELTPNQAGTYTFYCTVAGHKEGGMMGTLIVK